MRVTKSISDIQKEPPVRRIALRELDEKREKYIWKYPISNCSVLRQDEDRITLTLALEDLILDLI
jgi:hypothetical protein